MAETSRSSYRFNLPYLTCFDGPRIYSGWSEVQLSTQQTSLVALFAGGSKTRYSRDEVTTLLWAAGTDRVLRRRLNQLVYSLNRKSPDGRLLRHKRGFLALSSDHVTRELDVYWKRLNGGEVDEATSMLRKGLLAGLASSPTREFKAWLSRRRVEVKERSEEILHRHWARAFEAGKGAMALKVSQCLLEFDPMSEQALRMRIRSLVAADRKGEAEAVLEDFEARQTRVSERRTWSPTPRTQEVIDESLEAREARSSRRETYVAGQESFPMVGREKALGRFKRAMTACPEGHATTVLVSGAAGMGKTRLVTEALRQAENEGHAILYGRSGELEREIPLNGLLDALDCSHAEKGKRTLHAPWRTVVSGLVPRLSSSDTLPEDPPRIRPGHALRRTFDALRRLLSAIARDKPVVLFIDDLQWTDETSIAALEYIRTRWDQGRLVLILAVRPEEVEKESALARFVESLEGDEAVLALSVSGLARQDRRRLIRSVAGDRIEPRLEEKIARLGGGSPFFLIQLTLEWSAGQLQLAEYAEGKFDSLVLPARILNVFRRRFRELSSNARRLLELLTTVARPLHVVELLELSGNTPEATAQAISQLSELHLVRSREDQTIETEHDLVRQAVYSQLSIAHRALLHREVADHLLTRAQSVGAEQLALHLYRAGDRERAMPFAREAAERAEAAGAIREAIKYLRIAEECTDEDKQLATVRWKLGRLYHLSRDFDNAPDLLATASADLARQGRARESLEAQISHIDALDQAGILEPEGALLALRRIEQTATESAAWNVMLNACDLRLRLLDRLGDAGSVREVLDRIDSVGVLPDAELECMRNCILSIHQLYGDPEKGDDTSATACQIGRAIARRAPDLSLKAINRRMMVMIGQGTLGLQEGQECIRLAKQLSTSSGDLLGRFFPELNRGIWHVRLRDCDTARSAFRRAQELLQGSQEVTGKLLLRYNQGLLELEDDRYDAAQNLLYEAQEVNRRHPHRGAQVLIAAGLGLCSLERGALAEANEWNDVLGTFPRRWHFDPYLVVRYKSRLLAAQGQLKAALELVRTVADEIHGRFVPTWIDLKVMESQLLRRLREEPENNDLSAVFQVAMQLNLRRRAKILSALEGR